MNRTKRVFVNAATNYLRFALTMVVVFFLTPVIIRSVGKEDFGLWSLAFSVLGFFALLDFGIGTSIVRFVGETRGEEDADRRRRLMSTIAALYAALAAVATIGILALTLVFHRVFDIPEAQRADAVAILWILGLRSVVLSLPLGLFRGVLFGEQRIALINLIQGIGTLIYGAVAWAVLSAGHGVVALAWVNLGAMLIEHAGYVVMAYRVVPGLRLSLRWVDRTVFREVASLGTSQLIVNISGLVLLRSDPIIVKMAMPLSAVAVYTVALRVAESVHLLAKQGVNVLAPVIAEMRRGGEGEAIRMILIRGTKFALAPTVLLSFGLAALSRDVIVLWVGDEFSEAAGVLVVLLVALTLCIPEIVASTVLTMSGHHRIASRAAVLRVLVNVGISLLLVESLGLIGVAVGTLVSSVAVDFAHVLRTTCRMHDVPFGTYVAKALAPALAPGLLQVLVTLWVARVHPPTALWELPLVAAPGAALFAVAFWRLGVNAGDRQFFAERLGRRRTSKVERVPT